MPENLLTITINATCIEHAQELLAVRSMPAVLPAGEDDVAAGYRLELQVVAKERDDARAALLHADEARKDAADTAKALDTTLTEVAGLVGFTDGHNVGGFVDHVRLVMERTAKALADAGAETTRLRDENKAQQLEIKRLNDLLGVDKAYPVATVPTAGKQPLKVGTQVWLGEPGNAEAGTVAEWRVEEDGSFAYAVALDGKPDPVWACDGDGDFHLERPKRKRRTKAEIAAEQAPWLKTYEPGEVVTASVDGEEVQASVVRQFDGSTKYEVEIAGRGVAVVDASQLAPLLDLQPEHEFKDERVSDGPHDDPLVDDEQYAEVKTAFQALGLSVDDAKALMCKHFPGISRGRELRVSQARALVDTILPGSVKVPEKIPF